MSRILFVINPKAGGQEKSELVKMIRSLNKDVEIFQTTGENDSKKVKDHLESNQYDRVVVAGGDGTVAMVAIELIGKKIPLGIIPAGSANGLAHELALPIRPEKALQKAITDPPKPFDIIQINDKWHMIHMADFGMNATLVKRYQTDKHRGILGYAISGLKEIGNLVNTSVFELETENKQRNMESSFVIIANARSYGTGIEVNPRGSVNDGKFEICCLKSIPFVDFLEQFIDEREFEFNPFQILSTDQANIHLKEETDFQIDGEYVGKVSNLQVKMLEGAVQVVY